MSVGVSSIPSSGVEMFSFVFCLTLQNMCVVFLFCFPIVFVALFVFVFCLDYISLCIVLFRVLFGPEMCGLFCLAFCLTQI